jgi:hypothetical protein
MGMQHLQSNGEEQLHANGDGTTGMVAENRCGYAAWGCSSYRAMGIEQLHANGDGAAGMVTARRCGHAARGCGIYRAIGMGQLGWYRETGVVMSHGDAASTV